MMREEKSIREQIPNIRYEPDGKWENVWVEIKTRINSIRDLRGSILSLGYVLDQEPGSRGLILLVDSRISDGQLNTERNMAGRLIGRRMMERLTIATKRGDMYEGLPADPGGVFRNWLEEQIVKQRPLRGERDGRWYYYIFHILLNAFLANTGALSTSQLREICGCSRPTVSGALLRLDPYLNREPGHKFRLKQIPKPEFARYLAMSGSLRMTARFVDRSGKPRSAESHVKRLVGMGVTDLAVGGVLGAHHYFSGIDIAGVPRLDLCLHDTSRRPDLRFMEQLDPALKLSTDPTVSPNVVVHMTRTAKNSFEQRDGGIMWADRVNCLMDLYDANLEWQADEFLMALRSQQTRPGSP